MILKKSELECACKYIETSCFCVSDYSKENRIIVRNCRFFDFGIVRNCRFFDFGIVRKRKILMITLLFDTMELFRRKVYEDLLEWKNSDAGSTAMMLDGARRVGKSTVAEEFAKRNYRSYILLDFSEQNQKVKGIFDLFPSDKEAFSAVFNYISEKPSILVKAW